MGYVYNLIEVIWNEPNKNCDQSLNIIYILDCCQIIILSIYVPSTHAYTHVLRLSLDLPYETRYTKTIEAPF